MANRISTILDLDGSGFGKTLKGIGSSIGQADGIMGKFKAGSKATFDGLKQFSGEAALAAGAALVTFGVKAVGAFTEVAKSALDLSSSTGLMVEDASRWLGLADDYKVSAEAMATGLGKITKTMDSTKWAEYGIATRDAGGKSRDVNDILLDTFDMLSKVNNKTDQARIGQQLFGKGYQSLTPILGHTRAEYEKMLGAVEKGQVITEKEAKKAERMRLAQDALSDSFKEITLAVGGLASGMAPMVEQTTKGVTKFLELAESADNLTSSLGGLKGVVDFVAANPMTAFNAVMDSQTKVLDETGWSLEELVKRYTEAGSSAETIAKKVEEWNTAHGILNPTLAETNRETRKLVEGMGEVRDREHEAAEAAAAYGRQVDKTSSEVQADIAAIQAKWDVLTGNLNAERAWINLKTQAEEVKVANEEAGKAVKEHGPGSPEAIASLEAARVKAIDLELATADYAKEVAGLPPEKATIIAAMIGAGDIDKALAAIDQAFLTHAFRINAHLDNIIVDGETHAAGAAAGFSAIKAKSSSVAGTKIPDGAEGGIVKASPGGTIVRVAEAGHDEALIPLDGKHGGGGTTTNYYTVNMPVGTKPDEMMRTLEKWRQRNGNASWMAPAGGISGGTP